MINEIQKKLIELLQGYVEENYGIELEGGYLFEIPDDRKWGELTCRVAFILSKKIKSKPITIAEEISKVFNQLDFIKNVEIAGGGFINIYIDRKEYLRSFCESIKEGYRNRLEEKVIIEHTNINPNKSAHVGHIRNACLGDTLARLLKYVGYKVEVQNYIDDTGVQLADVIVGFIFLEKMDIDTIKSIKDKLDYYCWDLYSKVNNWYEQDKNNLSKRYEVLKAIEMGDNKIAEIANYVSSQIVKAHLNTMLRLGIKYELLTQESDIIHYKFWDDAFGLLKKSNAIQYMNEGKYAGCWIMPFSEHPELSNLSEPDKILVRSNGTLTYVAKDIAYQMWKFGLLSKDFNYCIFHKYTDDEILWQSCKRFNTEMVQSPTFGRANKVYNVIDVRQSYLQKIVSESLRLVGYIEQATNSIHFSYEVVALSPKTCKEMNLSTDVDEKKDFVGMSGRKGIGIKSDDFIDMVEKKSCQEIQSRNPSLPEKDVFSIAKLIACAAIRYYMLKYSRNKIIVFDVEEALNFDGETGPYLQYAAVRANNILNKLKDKKLAIPDLSYRIEDYPSDDYLYSEDFSPIWDLIFSLSLIRNIAAKAIESMELMIFAKFAYSLAQKFNYFYYHYDVIHLEDKHTRNFRSFLVSLFRSQYYVALDLLGIPIPIRM